MGLRADLIFNVKTIKEEKISQFKADIALSEANAIRYENMKKTGPVNYVIALFQQVMEHLTERSNEDELDIKEKSQIVIRYHAAQAENEQIRLRHEKLTQAVKDLRHGVEQDLIRKINVRRLQQSADAYKPLKPSPPPKHYRP